MINARKINKVNFWKQTGTAEADHILLYNFHNYNFDGSDAVVSYKLGFIEIIPTSVTSENGDVQTVDSERWSSLYEGSIILPNTIVQEWGEDDEPIFDYVIEELNLTRDNS